MKLLEIPVDKIVVENRLRLVNPEKVAQIRFSMEELVGGIPRGQMTPIEVSQADFDGNYRLVAGEHRYEAVRAAGLPTIQATLYEGADDPDSLRLREIDENLYRNDLSPYDFATFIAERAKIYEKLRNRPIKQGPKKFRQVDGNSFTVETAEALGFSAATIERARRRVKHIPPETWGRLRGTEIAENGTYLDFFAGLKAPEQRAVLEAMKGGASFSDAMEAFRKPPSAPKTDREAADALYAKFQALTPDAQELFRKLIRRKAAGASAKG